MALQNPAVLPEELGFCCSRYASRLSPGGRGTSGKGSQIEYEAEGCSQCSSDLGNEPDLHGMLDLLEQCSWTCGSAGEIKLSQERVQSVALHSAYTEWLRTATGLDVA